jgi:hypothetical protein
LSVWSRLGSQGDRTPDRIEQLVAREGFGVNVNGSTLHCAHRARNVAVPGKEDHGQRIVHSGYRILKFKTALPPHPQVHHDTSGRTRPASQECLRGTEGLDLEVSRL